ncbi:hypothetical protein [Rhodococcus kronopolitis]|uniref:Uncharacterized protein n=1 Tax=Rhodococcus kronopolitis TaxID=1460226 RepID=A0ABV9FTF9_9NOCA
MTDAVTRHHRDPVPREERDDWVPVDRRILGLDRRTLLPALGILLLAFLYATVVPAIDRSIAYDDPVAAGEVLVLADGVTVDPPDGWNLVSGLRATDTTTSGIKGTDAVFGSGTMVLSMSATDFGGSVDALLDEAAGRSEGMNRAEGLRLTGERQEIYSGAGTRGVVEKFTEANREGFFAAFVDDGTAVTITGVGLPGDVIADNADVETTMRSIRFERQEATE